MLFDETLIELFDIDIGLKKDFLLDRLKWFVVKKIGIFLLAALSPQAFVSE